MIEARTYYNTSERSVSLEVSGHAGLAAHGEDIVCAAASILVYTFAQIVTALDGTGDIIEQDISISSGDALVEAVFKDDDGLAEAIRALLYTQTGFRLLEGGYPDRVRIITDEA
jgi:uncharacterized protein YsxB (DUF464 family)